MFKLQYLEEGLRYRLETRVAFLPRIVQTFRICDQNLSLKKIEAKNTPTLKKLPLYDEV